MTMAEFINTEKVSALYQAANFRVMPERFKELLCTNVIAIFYDVQEPLAHFEPQ
jgi:hypothetical protein